MPPTDRRAPAAARAEGPRVLTFESRMSEELGGLARRHGLTPIAAPALEEVPVEAQPEARAFGQVLMGGGCDLLLLLTGVGARRLFEAMALDHPQEALTEALGRARLACRGHKPVRFLKELGLRPALTAPEPNTRDALLGALDASLPVAGLRVYVQEYGERDEALLEGLRARGAAYVGPVPVYGYAMPRDTGPLEAALDRLLEGQAEAALFTSRAQVHNLFALAAARGRADALAEALRARVLVASIGPVTTEGLACYAVPADVEPEHAKMGQSVIALARALHTGPPDPRA